MTKCTFRRFMHSKYTVSNLRKYFSLIWTTAHTQYVRVTKSNKAALEVTRILYLTLGLSQSFWVVICSCCAPYCTDLNLHYLSCKFDISLSSGCRNLSLIFKSFVKSWKFNISSFLVLMAQMGTHKNYIFITALLNGFYSFHIFIIKPDHFFIYLKLKLFLN